MNEILDTIGSAIGAVVDNPVIQFGFQLFAIYWVVLWLAAAYWAFRDLQLRTENPIAPYLAATLVILFTPVLFPLAVYTYRVVRPQERIGDIYERNLAEEAMLAEIEAIPHCPSCDRRVDRDWIICPTCRTRLNRVCPSCGKLVGLDWSLCAWCGKDFERREVPAAAIVSEPSWGNLPGPSVELEPGAVRSSVRSVGSRSAASGSAGSADALSEP